jgi:hypothetical protein
MKQNLLKSLSGIFMLLTLVTACRTETDENKENENTEVNTRQASPEKMIETLVGEWKVESIKRGEQDVTDAEGGGDQRLIFTSEARYIRRSGNQKVDSGAYRMNEQLRNLYFESGANVHPKEFDMMLDSGALVLRPKAEGNSQQNLTYTYRRLSGNQ